MKFLSIIALVFTSLFAPADIVTKNFKVSDFDAINISVPADVIYVTGKPKLEITASERIMNSLEVEVENGELVIKSELKTFWTRDNFRIYVSSRKLNNVKLKGSADFKAPQGIDASNFKATINGSGDLEINGLKVVSAELQINGSGDIELGRLQGTELRIGVNGSGDVDLNGSVKDLDVKINGSGDVDISELRVDRVNTKINGSGSVKRFDD